ncbi:hypothetical protein C7Y70_11055 [Pseudoalteromonas sp. KS88]|uniref:hypothetical protein n=1 Tax=Pseudoalteromonas sp. KS88 TaxID=2109918 RepID=UPI0010811C01|nr:hypothetical protein [Pseudoalteromonas sp. KS88]TGE83224.1 hypothetical protein C7Y70_11055 [Pseudoalteromonas sp. KS88]
MKLDDLKQDWQQAIETESTPDNLTEVIDMIEQQTTKIDKEIKRRDFLEIGIAVFLIPVWIWGLLNSASTMQSIGLIIAIVACIYIPYRLISAKKVNAKKSDSVKDFLVQEKQKIQQQKQMLESVVWWYIAPLTVAILLITLGAKVNEQGIPQIALGMVWYYACVGLLVLGVYFLNKRAAKNKFAPLLKNIEQRLAEMS